MIKRILTALAVCFAVPAVAGVKYDTDNHILTIDGMTTSYQQSQVFDIFQENEVTTVVLSGPGGDYYAGLAIGRYLREEGARAIIPAGKECVSACAFAMLGADEIHIDGKVMFHRPFTMATPSMVTVEAIAAKYGAAYIDGAVYLMEQGVSAKFMHQILRNTTPCKFMVVTDESGIADLRKWGVLRDFDTESRCQG